MGAFFRAYPVRKNLSLWSLHIYPQHVVALDHGFVVCSPQGCLGDLPGEINAAAEAQRLWQIGELNMIQRIPQRTKDDCAICTVAMVMGQPYTYERVLNDSARYPKLTENGRFICWWQFYLEHEGFQTAWMPLSDLGALPSGVRAIIGMDVPRLRRTHIAAVDELWVIDPADGAPPYITLQEYFYVRSFDGFVFHNDLLAVRKDGRG